MTILRWVLLTALAVAFLLLAVANWTPVQFRLPDGSIAGLRLPLLLGIAFVAGWLPTWLIHLGAKAGWKRRLAKAERGLTDAFQAVHPPEPLPAQAQPTVVPPAGA